MSRGNKQCVVDKRKRTGPCRGAGNVKVCGGALQRPAACHSQACPSTAKLSIETGGRWKVDDSEEDRNRTVHSGEPAGSKAVASCCGVGPSAAPLSGITVTSTHHLGAH